MVRARVVLILLSALFLFMVMGHAQGFTDNAVYAKQFPGSTVGAKVTAAMAACNPDTNITCYVVIDASLKAFPAGTLPAMCSHCALDDYRAGGGGPVAMSINPCTPEGIFPVSLVALACDGATDDSTAMQALFTALNASSIPVDVYFPAARINLTKQIILVNAPVSPIRIHGMGSQTVFNFTAEDAQGSGLVVENATVPVEVRGISTGGTSFVALQVVFVTGGFTLSDSYISGGAQGATVAGKPPSALYIQGGSHLKIENNFFTGNGPQTGATSCTDKNSVAVICPQGYTVVTGYQYFAGNLTTSLTQDLKFTGNEIYSNNNLIGLAGFSINKSRVANNFIDQGNAFLNDNTADAEAAQGYCALSYGAQHVNQTTGTWVSSVRSASNVVTVTMTASSIVPYVVGQWIGAASNALGQTNSSQFGGAFVVASVTGSGGATPQFTYNQNGPADSLAGAPDYVNLNIGNNFVANTFQNCAGSGLYMQGQIDGSVAANQIWNTGQMMDSLQIPVGGISCNGCIRESITGNNINTAITINPNQIGGQSYKVQGIALANNYDVSVSQNSIFNFGLAGIWIGTAAEGVSMDHNSIDGNGVAGSAGIFSVAATPWRRLVATGNKIKQVLSAGIDFETVPAGGYGIGGVIANNTFAGNTAAAPLGFGIFVNTGNQVQVSGNTCDGLAYGTVGGRTINTCLEMQGGTRNSVRNNIDLGSSNSFYAFFDSSSGDEWSGNIVGNASNCFNSTGSTNLRVYSNMFGQSTTAGTFTWAASAMHFDNLFTTDPGRGTCTLVAGTCTVTTHEVLTGDVVRLNRTVVGGTIGTLSYGTITNGTSFVVTSSSGTDTSGVYWEILH